MEAGYKIENKFFFDLLHPGYNRARVYEKRPKLSLIIVCCFQKKYLLFA